GAADDFGPALDLNKLIDDFGDGQVDRLAAVLVGEGIFVGEALGGADRLVFGQAPGFHGLAVFSGAAHAVVPAATLAKIHLADGQVPARRPPPVLEVLALGEGVPDHLARS